jgi:hypothetical protein
MWDIISQDYEQPSISGLKGLTPCMPRGKDRSTAASTKEVYAEPGMNVFILVTDGHLSIQSNDHVGHIIHGLIGV